MKHPHVHHLRAFSSGCSPITVNHMMSNWLVVHVSPAVPVDVLMAVTIVTSTTLDTKTAHTLSSRVLQDLMLHWL